MKTNQWMSTSSSSAAKEIHSFAPIIMPEAIVLNNAPSVLSIVQLLAHRREVLLFSETNLMLYGFSAVLQILVWTGFAQFVGVFFGLLYEG